MAQMPALIRAHFRGAVSTMPLMSKTLIFIPGLLLLIGCGGHDSEGSTVEHDLPAVYHYPAYKAVSEEGDELFIQVPSSTGEIDGRYAFFVKGADATDILSGPVNGSVTKAGVVNVNLYNPYDPSEEPIQLTGKKVGANLELTETDTGETATFKPMEPSTVTLTRASYPYQITIGTTSKDPVVTVDPTFTPLLLWLLPPTWVGEATPRKTTSYLPNIAPYRLLLSSWGNGWTEVSVGQWELGNYFEGWVNINPADFGKTGVSFQNAKAMVNQNPTKWENVSARP